MKHSESIVELSIALSLAQSEMGGASKSANNPFFKSKYADLGEVIHCVKEPFANHGISFVQFPVTEEGRAGVETIIMHKSGQWISNEFTLKCAKDDPQGIGSAITYARRYGLQSACGIPSEDDDGNAATKPASKQEKPKDTPPPEPVKKLTPSEAAEAMALKVADLSWFELVYLWKEPANCAGKPLSDIAANANVDVLEAMKARLSKLITKDTPSLVKYVEKVDKALTEAKSTAEFTGDNSDNTAAK